MRDDLLKLLAERCRELHSIAFLQWRMLYPSDYVLKGELEDLILARLQKYKRGTRLLGRPLKATQGATTVTQRFIDTYEREDIIKCSHRPHVLNTFWQLGWADPFPLDAKD